MIYRSGEKNFGYSSEFKIQHKRRGLATERACQSGTQSWSKITSNVESTLFQAVSLLCAWLEGCPFGFEGGTLFNDKI